MIESKIDATHRLMREGLWEEASQYRTEMRQKFRAEKMSRADASDAAWAAMFVKYPPGGAQPAAGEPAESEAPTVDVATIEAILARTGAAQPDVVGDINWVYSHLSDDAAAPQDVPSLGAWSLRHWARDNSNRFFEQLLPKAMAVRNQQEEADAGEREELRRIDELERELDVLHAEWEAELLEDPPARIKESVLGNLSDVARRFRLEMPGGAANELAARMVQLALR